MKGVVDINKYKEMKEKKVNKNKPNPDVELLKKLVSTPIKDLEHELLKPYAEIGVVFTTMFRENHYIVFIEFRGQYYVLNNLGDGTFEYIGSFNEILEIFVR